MMLLIEPYPGEIHYLGLKVAYLRWQEEVEAKQDETVKCLSGLVGAVLQSWDEPCHH
jgi:hypothetical protein